MKRLIPFLLFVMSCHAQTSVLLTGVGSPPSGAAATPGFVNEMSKNSIRSNAVGNNAGGQTACSNFAFCLPFVDLTLAGNLGIVSGHFANSTTITPTNADDKSNTWTCATGGSKDSGTNEWPFLCYAPNMTAGTNRITTSYGSTAVTQVTEKAAQFSNIATSSPLDGSIGSCAGASSSTANCASVTTTQANDLIYVLVCRAGTPAVTSFTAGSGFTLITEDVNDGCASEWEVASGTGSVTPSMTMASASTYIEIVAAFKSASAGTAPTGTYLARVLSYSTPSSFTGNLNWQFISSGNFLMLTTTCGGTIVPQTPTDATNTWTSLGAQTSSGEPTSEFYAKGAVANSTGAITIGHTGTGGDCTETMYDFVGAPSSPIVVRSQNTSGAVSGVAALPWDGTDLADGSTLGGFLPNPSTGFLVAVGGQQFNTTSGITAPSSGCVFDGGSWGGESLSGGGNWVDQNNTYAHCYFTTPDQPIFSFTQASSGTAPNGWAGDLVGVFGTTGTAIVNFTENVVTSSATLNITVPATTSGNLLAVAIGNFNATARTVSKVCLDGATCAAGNTFTQFTGAVSTGSGHAATDIWYLLSAPSGKTTVTVTLSASASNIEAAYYEVQKGSGASWVTDGAAHVTNGTGGTTGSPNFLITGASVTTTGSLDFCVAGAGVSNGNIHAVTAGTSSTFTYGRVYVFKNTSDGGGALLTSLATAHVPAFFDNSSGDSFSTSTGCWK